MASVERIGVKFKAESGLIFGSVRLYLRLNEPVGDAELEHHRMCTLQVDLGVFDPFFDIAVFIK
jgi:hypothetical protein